MATAVVHKQHSSKAPKETKSHTVQPAAEPTCVLESLRHKGLECHLCTWHTVVGPVEIIQRDCPVVKLVSEKLSHN